MREEIEIEIFVVVVIATKRISEVFEDRDSRQMGTFGEK